MITVSVTVKGRSAEDVAFSLEVVTRQLREGFTSGFDSNHESGDSYSFTTTGEEEDAPQTRPIESPQGS